MFCYNVNDAMIDKKKRSLISSLGGNQRELARAKNAKKLQQQVKGKGAAAGSGHKGASLDQRKEKYVCLHIIYMYVYVCADIFAMSSISGCYTRPYATDITHYVIA